MRFGIKSVIYKTTPTKSSTHTVKQFLVLKIHPLLHHYSLSNVAANMETEQGETQQIRRPGSGEFMRPKLDKLPHLPKNSNAKETKTYNQGI